MGAMMQRQQSQQKPTFFQDMFDGGGMGATGDSFKGAGLYSGLLNMLGIKPMGAQDRATMASFQSAQNAPPAVMQAIQRAQAPMTSPMPQARPVVGAQPQYSGRGSAGMPMPQPQYSGRGAVGMPMPPFVGMMPNPQEASSLVDYLRRSGVQGY
jgi:hypothetical protein